VIKGGELLKSSLKYWTIVMLIVGLLFPSSALATSSYSYSDSQSTKSFFSFFFSFSSSKGSNDWDEQWGDEDWDKDWDHDWDHDWDDDDWEDWDGCLREKKDSSKCVESKDVWHDWYCWKKGDHDHDHDDDDKDDYSWYDKDWDDNKQYTWGDWSIWKWW
jgi:hypothetical protein